MNLKMSGSISTETIAINSFIILCNGGIFLSNSKDFKNLNDQISILSNRGLRINDYEKCKQYLLTNNYYNIINGYSKFFQKNDNDIYI